jgi:hypothetical protein
MVLSFALSPPEGSSARTLWIDDAGPLLSSLCT